MTFINILAQAADGAAPAAQPANQMNIFFMMGLFMLAMWFLLIAPQRKRQKEHQKMMNALQVGDEIITSGGLFGTIQQVRNDRFVVKIADGTRVELAKGYIISKSAPDTDKK
ncbi:MAG: preprotein translocase subunit YajC [Opitutales bacterium]|jgi:preprotein translocase subunit YajC